MNSEICEVPVTVEENEIIVTSNPLPTDKTVRKRVRKLYNSACLTLLIQFGLSMVISGIISGVYGAFFAIQAMFQNPELEPTLLIEKVLQSALSPRFLIISVAVSHLIANLLSYFIGNVMTKKHHTAKIFGRIKMKPFDCILAIFSVIGVQMISMLIQAVLMSATGLSGIDPETADAVTLSDDMLHNIILLVYTVLIAAITEELLCRGVILKALSVKSVTFGLIASSLIFGILHGNFNQIINGFLLGMVIGYAAIKSRSIILPIILHMCANGHAMLLSFLEYKLGESIIVFEVLYIILMTIIGTGAIVWLVIRNGLPNNKTDGFSVTYTIEGLDTLESKKGLTWLTLFKAVMFWIFVALYLITAISSLSVIA